SLARLRAVRERGANRDGRVHARDDVGDRDTRSLRAAARRAVGLAGNAHHSAHALDHEVIAGPLAVRTGLAESGDRAVDQARMHAVEIVIAQAVTRQVAVLVVFDKDIAFAGERTDKRLAGRLGHVDGDRFLATVRRSEIGGVLRVAAFLVLHPRRPESTRV